jgi:hypothetical protein
MKQLDPHSAGRPSRPKHQLVLDLERAKRRCEDAGIAARCLCEYAGRRKRAQSQFLFEDFADVDVVGLDLEWERLDLCIRLLKERARHAL